jgi:general secretion pathway protein F/type IV pilus assembly protein PilC
VARKATGDKVTGSLAAASRQEVLAILASQSLFPVEIRAEAPRRQLPGRRRIPMQLLAITYSQLADLLRSGVPLLRALDVLRKQTAHARLSEILSDIHDRVENGTTLGDAMARFEHVFGEMAVSMIRAGGEGGFLEEALARVAEFTETQDDLRRRTLGAMAYPMMLAVVGLLVVTGLVIFVVPRFEQLFGRLRERGELPALTDWLLWLSNLPWRWEFWFPWGGGILGGLILGGAAIARWLQTDQGRLWRDQMKLRLPVAGGIFLSLSIARFCRVLGTMLRNGVPILRSLQVASDAAGNRVLTEAIKKATENIRAGQNLAGPLAASGHFPPTILAMIAVAEESNTLETVLIQIADSLEKRTWRQLDLAVRLLEPVMLLLLAGAVLMVLVGLLYPMFKMSYAL